MSPVLKTLLRIIVMVIAVIITIEVALTLFDPWGMKYFDDLAAIAEKVVTHPARGYVLPAGQYQFSHWRALQLDNFTRNVPNNAKGSCKVAFLGDSVTWGHGVDDQDTWVNLLAQQLPQINAINTAIDGYNSENVRRTIADFPDAAVIVYMIIGNDADVTGILPKQPRLTMIEKYIRYIMIVRGIGPDAAQAFSPPTDEARFDHDMQLMSQDKRVIFIGFDDAFDQRLKDKYNVHLIPPIRNRISYVDAHPNPAGHRDMMAAILPIVKEAVAQRCPSAEGAN